MAGTSDYKRFLGEKILTEDQVITYRYLSRALSVHVNVAKQMLYEFHKSQNDRKPGSVHATYLMYGVKRATEQPSQADDGDVEMAEEPSEHVPIYTLSITKEEDLGDCLELYDHVSSIHVYSIGPSPTKDLQLLSEHFRQVLDMSADEDPVERSRKYGAITNPHVQRRERKAAAPIPKPAAAGPVGISKKAVPSRPAASAAGKEAAKEEAKSKAPPASGPFARAAAKEENKSSQTPSSSAAAAAPDKKPTPSMKRGGSGIMQAFAKAGAAKPKAKAAAPAAEASAMSDDGEDEDDAVPAPKQAADSGNNSRKEREEALKRMMEEEDEADKAAEEEEEEEEERADTPMEEPEEEAPAPASKPEEPAEVVSASTGDGRRRGRRRVMKKKQIMDDQGYLVTINEPGWESFSEDEAPPKPTSAKPPASAAAAKPKKAAPKGQGNIMSFFSKKA